MTKSHHCYANLRHRISRPTTTIGIDVALAALTVTPGILPEVLASALDAQHVLFFVTLHGQAYCDRKLTHQFRTIWIDDMGYDARRYFYLIEDVLRKYGAPLLKTPGSFIHVRRSLIRRLTEL